MSEMANAPLQRDLTIALAEVGLIQFGRFEQDDGAIWPVALRLRWLPSYPALLAQVAAALADLLPDGQADRVLTTHEATPLGVAVGLASGVPVTYPFGELRDYTAAFAIEGAYDVGHPTVLVADVLAAATQAADLTHLARRVGLNVHDVIAVVDLGVGARSALVQDGFRVRAALSLDTMLPVLADAGWVSVPMRQRVVDWQTSMRES